MSICIVMASFIMIFACFVMTVAFITMATFAVIMGVPGLLFACGLKIRPNAILTGIFRGKAERPLSGLRSWLTMDMGIIFKCAIHDHDMDFVLVLGRDGIGA
ncbi:MAG: hypothetical protein CFE35_18305 [Novosphingobium sp. PASSN1]|nr:MAG: hypothetical protein CFE35_18305 [Novosphingobium sp. PASSN1]